MRGRILPGGKVLPSAIGLYDQFDEYGLRLSRAVQKQPMSSKCRVCDVEQVSTGGWFKAAKGICLDLPHDRSDRHLPAQGPGSGCTMMLFPNGTKVWKLETA